VTTYVIYQADILDPTKYEEYKEQAAPNIAAAGGRYVVRGGDATALEGELPAGRTVVLTFPTRRAALDWYHSEEYTAIRKLRDGSARATLYIVDGVDEAGTLISERLTELGIALPPPFPPAGNYLACVVDDGLVYVGGHGPIDGADIIRGKVGGNLTLEEGREAARRTALSILATLQQDLGDLDRIERIVKVFGMVNVAPGFNQTPAVIDGCSDLLVDIFGDAGRHTRSAVGLAELPFDIAVEIELTARLRTS